MKSFFVLPIHNKEDLIVSVLKGICNSCSDNYHVVCIFDGCIDSSEALTKDFIASRKLSDKFTLLYLNDVHEITCLNHGLEYIEKLNPDDDDLVFTVQDDVILLEPDLDIKFSRLFKTYTDLGYISMRLGSSIVYMNDTIGESNYFESEFGHWKQLGLKHFSEVKHGEFVETPLAIRSPTCVQWKRYREVGFYDSALAPCGYDCHDFSIRMNEHGYRNGVYAMKFRSDVNWGGMRSPEVSEINKKFGEIYERNRRYLAIKHRTFFISHAK